jgi:hypothetical protein
MIGEIGESTALMNKSQFMEYLDKIKIWAATYLSLNIPDPEEQTKLFQEQLVSGEPSTLIASAGDGVTLIEKA